MKYCGVVTDRSWYHASQDNGDLSQEDVLWCPDDVLKLTRHNYDCFAVWKRRIYSDEVPMADKKTLRKFGMDEC